MPAEVSFSWSTSIRALLSNAAGASSDTPDPDPGNNEDGASATVTALADLGVEKSVTPNPVFPGAFLTYGITVRNQGPLDALNVLLSDVVPAHTTFVSFTAAGGWASVTPPVGGTGSVTASIATLAVGALGSFALVVKVDPGVPQSTLLSNAATVAGDRVDPNPADNEALATALATSAAPVPRLSFTGLAFLLLVLIGTGRWAMGRNRSLGRRS